MFDQETLFTYVCTVFQQQLGTAGVSLHTGSMQGRDSVQRVEVHTAALQAQRSHQSPGVNIRNIWLLNARRRQWPYLCDESLQGGDSSAEGGIVKGRPVGLNVCPTQEKTKRKSRLYFESIALKKHLHGGNETHSPLIKGLEKNTGAPRGHSEPLAVSSLPADISHAAPPLTCSWRETQQI